MTALIDHSNAAQLMAGLTLNASTQRDSEVAYSMREETRMEVLAMELVHYMPELALLLAKKGRERLLRA